jgi:hypothetical protein
MNCHDARERLSDVIDDVLGAPDRALVQAHLDGCPDCRRELERLHATVSLLSRVERPRAPVGFVDRVMAAAHPVASYRRLGRSLFVPLGIKLPAGAAAMVMIAVLGVFLLQGTPEMQDAARPDLQSPVSRSETPATKNAEPAPSGPPAENLLKGGEADSGKLTGQAPRPALEAEKTMRDGTRRDFSQSSPPASEELKQEARKEGDADRLQKAGAPAPAAPPAESRAKSRDAAEGQSGALAPAPSPAAPPASSPPAPASPEMSAKRQSAVSGVLGRLNVKDRPSAEKGLADLLTRLGGSETGRRQELGATVVEVVVPEARYADFVRGLTTLGGFTAEGQPTALPTDPPQLRFSLRISE